MVGRQRRGGVPVVLDRSDDPESGIAQPLCRPTGPSEEVDRHEFRNFDHRIVRSAVHPVRLVSSASDINHSNSGAPDLKEMNLQLSLIDEETVAAPAGLEYHCDFLTAAEEDCLLERIDDSAWLADLSRRVLHFGYKYDYTSRKLDESSRIRPLPEWLARLSHVVREAASEEAKQLLDPDQPFEQAIINEYMPGQGIAPHFDRDRFGPIVATVSLGSAVNMDLHCDSTEVNHVRRLEPRSLLLLCGDARSKWRHGIAKRNSDTWNGHKTKRRRRVSITFRTIADDGDG